MTNIRVSQLVNKSLLFATILLLISCVKPVEENLLKKALSSKNIRIRTVMDSLEQYELQIRYTQINRKNDSVFFTDFDFQVDINHYFYPASTVKFPTAVAALEKLNELDSINRHTRFYIEGDTTETTINDAIEEIFAVSDNLANNRLIEFLGFDALNKRVGKRGITPIRISHRLSTSNADDITTKPLVIYTNDSTTITSEAIFNNIPENITIPGILKGRGFYENDSLYQEAFDFSLKNYYPIATQHGILKRIIFPNQFSEKEQFNLSEEQYDFLLNAMSTLPEEAGYDPIEYYDSYGKFFMYGDSKKPIPNYIKIYNKVGYAYGTLTDCAYIKDTKNNIDFMITATILVNKNGIFNDDDYEYEQVGIPFLAELGRELYTLELKRKR